MRVIAGGVTAPKGFAASGVAAGIKKSGKKDFALLYSVVPAVAAAAFTKNRFQASPIKVSAIHIRNKIHQAVIVNSGNANCANGKRGDADAVSMAGLAAEGLGLDPKEVLVASTGIIGRPLPVDKIKKVFPTVLNDLSRAGGTSFAKAILTTDTVKKELAVKVRIGGADIRIGGACKGVGMIYPDMAVARHATTLAFITTDAVITKARVTDALEEAIGDSFNMISVDGDMSTNDACFILANGLAGNKTIAAKDKNYKIFTEALKSVSRGLAKALVRDGEGATKFVEIEVKGARTADEARRLARKVSASILLKCCIFGEDPNWGRVTAACGASDVRFDPDRTDIYLGDIKVLSNGASIKNYDKEAAKKLFKKKDIYIKIDLKSGNKSAKAWTCDLSKKYVEINAEYST